MPELTDSQPTCRNHQNSPGNYYSMDQPWVKYCGECALNQALSGKKIEKKPNPQKYDNKPKITRMTEKLKATSKEADLWHRELGEMAHQTEEEGRHTIRQLIADFDEVVLQLTRLRE